jgi:two-component system, OmpR family, KDP operon response regulator KdpE
MKLLVIDDDSHLCEALAAAVRLHWQNAVVTAAADGEAGVKRFSCDQPDVVLLDVMLPGMSGFEVLRQIRRMSDVPVIMLTGRAEDIDQVRGLELGADDYIAKPFSHRALEARIKSVLRRAELAPRAPAPADFRVGELAINFDNEEVLVAGERVKLTPVEYKLLCHLVHNAGHLVARESLLDRVWGGEDSANPESLKVFVSRLRAKLRHPSGPEYIQTERGRGYRFMRPRAVAFDGINT